LFRQSAFKVKNLVFILFISTLFFGKGFSQDNNTNERDGMFTIDTPITIDLGEEQEEEAVELKKKKRKKNVFYGIKTKKSFTKKGFGDNVVTEIFRVLKEHEQPDPYVRDIHWLDYRRKSIKVGGKIDPKYGAILHGPYKKLKGNQIIEEGIFYKGMKHGRWMMHDKNDLLMDKQKFYKGWPKESLVSYYDRERKKMKEIIPIEYGDKEGNYYYFHDNGRKAVQGEYKWDNKVGDWVEYYAGGGRKKIIR